MIALALDTLRFEIRMLRIKALLLTMRVSVNVGEWAARRLPWEVRQPG